MRVCGVARQHALCDASHTVHPTQCITHRMCIACTFGCVTYRCCTGTPNPNPNPNPNPSPNQVLHGYAPFRGETMEQLQLRIKKVWMAIDRDRWIEKRAA